MPHALRENMRVILFTDTLADINGVARFISDIARFASATGRDLTVVTSRSPAPPARSNVLNLTPRAGVPLPGYADLRLVAPPLRRARELITHARPDAVHVSTPGPVGLAGLLAARQARIPVVATYHTDFPAYVDHLFDNPSMEWLAEHAMLAFYSRAARVLTRSADGAKRVRQLGIHCRRLTRLRPGTDTDAFHPRFRDPGLGAALFPLLPSQTLRVLYVGRVSVEKNLVMLARLWPAAARTLAQASIPSQLVIVGDGPYRARMERELHDSPAAFLGFRHGTELARLYASSDLLVFPSATDTLGQVSLEAQASGIPVLVSDRGGPRELVRHDRTGLVVPADDERAWIDAIVTLARDPARRAAMGAAARTHMEDHSLGRSFEHWWQLHVDAAAAHRGGTDSPATDAC